MVDNGRDVISTLGGIGPHELLCFDSTVVMVNCTCAILRDAC